MGMRALTMTLTLLATPLVAQPLHIEERAPAWSATLNFSEAAARIPPLDAALRADAMSALDAFKAEAAAHAVAERPFIFNLDDRAAYVSDRVVSVVRAVESWTGGAHGAHSVEALTWDARTDSVITLDALLTPEGMETVAVTLREKIAREVHGGETPEFWRDQVNAATVASAMRLANYTLAAGADGGPTALDFHFSPYDVAPWSSGAPVIRVDAGVFGDHLTERGRALFAR